MPLQMNPDVAQKTQEKLADAQQTPVLSSPRTLDEQKRRLCGMDKLQMRLIAQADSVRRYQMMYPLRDYVIQTWKRGLQTKYPELSDMERCRLLFEKLQSNG
ncbi:MAG: hypothetical protein DWI57_12560 [Chloroflexi bacterium]|nr:MAG: hypothetical protein DWI57_12560 [Chloroflexota bacterium]